MKLGRLFMPRAVDALIVVLAVVAQLHIWALPVSGPTLGLAIAGLVGTLPLLARRRFPFGAPALIFAALAGMALVDPASFGEGSDGASVALVSLMLAFWFAGAHNGGEQVIAAVAIGLASTAVVVRSAGAEFAVVGDDSDLGVLGVFLIGGGLALAAFTLQRRARRTAALEDRAARLEREREREERAAVAAERTRIARDLHDVIAHSVAVMTVQAGAARLLLPEDPERARDAALSVEETGRQALTEMRRLLGILRTEEGEPALAPQPGIGDLRALLTQMETVGLAVELEIEGGPEPVPPGVDLAAYRIIDEALSHVLDDPDVSQARVTVRYGSEALDLEIRNDGRRAPSRDGRGDGLVAMRELVALYGGSLEAGPDGDRGYAVRARLRFPSAQPEPWSSPPIAATEQ